MLPLFDFNNGYQSTVSYHLSRVVPLQIEFTRVNNKVSSDPTN